MDEVLGHEKSGENRVNRANPGCLRQVRPAEEGKKGKPGGAEREAPAARPEGVS